MYPSNELGDQLQETERRESELSSKSRDLESKLLNKIKEAAEEVERKVGELLRTGDVCVCAVLVFSCAGMLLALFFHLLRRKAQATISYIMSCLFYIVLYIISVVFSTNVSLSIHIVLA